MDGGRFSIIPSRALDDRELGAAALRVLAVLGCYSDPEGWAWPSVRTLARRAGVGRSSIQRQLRELERLGYIETRRRRRPDGTDTSSTYRVLYDATLPAARRVPEEEEGGPHHAALGPHHAAGRAAPDAAPMNVPLEREKEKTPCGDLIDEGLREWAANYAPNVDLFDQFTRWREHVSAFRPEILSQENLRQAAAFKGWLREAEARHSKRRGASKTAETKPTPVPASVIYRPGVHSWAVAAWRAILAKLLPGRVRAAGLALCHADAMRVTLGHTDPVRVRFATEHHLAEIEEAWSAQLGRPIRVRIVHVRPDDGAAFTSEAA